MQHFVDTGFTSIPNFLPPSLAEKARDQLLQPLNSVSIHPYMPNCYCFGTGPDNAQNIADGTISAVNAYNRGEFSYLFYRQEPHSSSSQCECGLCEAIRYLQSPETMRIISLISGFDIKSTVSIFGSCYSANCFLSTHTDTGRGKIAFVLNLTENWNPENGGSLEFMAPDYRTVTRRVDPTFNTLVLFRVVGDGVPHRVCKVGENVKEKRIAISGWFDV